MRLNVDLPTIATFVEPSVRTRLDAASTGTFKPVHVGSLPEVVRVVREKPVTTFLFSPGYVGSGELAGVRALVDNFPGVSTVAVVMSQREVTGQNLLNLGASGVKHLVDLCDRNGWNRLRSLISEPVDRAVGLVVGQVMPLFGETSGQLRGLFEIMLRLAPEITTVRSLCAYLRVHPSTLMSRFLRAGIPSPRSYLCWFRLLHAAAILEDRGLSLSDAAYRLEHSSPQSFGRQVKSLLGCTAGRFRKEYDFDRTAGLFAEKMVVPFRSVFTTFEPLPLGVMLGQRKWRSGAGLPPLDTQVGE